MLIKKICNRLFRLVLNVFYKNINISKGSIIDIRCEIEKKSNIYMGEQSIIYKNATIYKHEDSIFKIGKNSHIAPFGYFLMDRFDITIGNSVAIAKNCSFFCVTNSIPSNSSILFKDSYNKGDITIGDNVFIGANCVILPNTIVEDNVVIGANSVVKGKLKSGFIYGGNTAKMIKRVFND